MVTTADHTEEAESPGVNYLALEEEYHTSLNRAPTPWKVPAGPLALNP